MCQYPCFQAPKRSTDHLDTLETPKIARAPCVDIFHRCQMRYAFSSSTHDRQILVQRSSISKTSGPSPAKTPATSAQFTARLHTPMVIPPESRTERSTYSRRQEASEFERLQQINRIAFFHMDTNSICWSVPNFCAIQPSDHPPEVALSGTA